MKHASEAILGAALGAAVDGMIVIDSAGVVQLVNPACERIFGFAASEIVGHNVNMLMPEPYHAEHDRYVQNYLATGARKIIGIGREVKGRRKDGTIFPMDLAVGEAHDGDQRFFVGIIRDITARKEADRRMSELQTELTQISRLSDVAEISAALAHDINQPLSAAMSYVQTGVRLIKGNKDPQQTVTLLEKSVAEITHASQVVQRVRSFVGHGAPQRGTANVGTIARETVELLDSMAEQARVRLDASIPIALPEIYADEVQIRQVLFNLARNAIEATKDSSVREVRIEAEHGADGFVMVTVRDTGPGLAESVRTQLFKPFVTTKPGGMGIGLSICRTIVASHGGTIEALPRPTGGTEFRVTLPITATEATHGS